MAQNDVRYLTPVNIEIKKDKYCRFKKAGIKFVDYKDADFLLKLLNEQGKILTTTFDRNFSEVPKKSEQGR